MEETPLCQNFNEPGKCNGKEMKYICDTGINIEVMSEDGMSIRGVRNQKLYQCVDCKEITAK